MGQKRRLVNPFDSRVQSTKKRTFCFYDSTLTRWLSSGSFSFQFFFVCQRHPRRRLIPAGRAFNYVHAVSYGRVDLFLKKNKFKLIVAAE